MLNSYAEYRKNNDIKANTIKYEVEQLESFLTFVEKYNSKQMEPYQIKPSDIKAYLKYQKEEKKVKDTTIKRKISAIRQYFDFLWKTGKVPYDFMPKLTYEYDIPKKIGSTNYLDLLNKKENVLYDARLLLNDKLYFLFTIKGLKLRDIEQLQVGNLSDEGNKVVLRFENTNGFIVEHSFTEDPEVAVLLQAIERSAFREHGILIASTNQKEPNYIRSNQKEILKRLHDALGHPFKGEEIRLAYVHYMYKVERKSLEEMGEDLGVSVDSIALTLKLVLERYKHLDYNKATN